MNDEILAMRRLKTHALIEAQRVRDYGIANHWTWREIVQTILDAIDELLPSDCPLDTVETVYDYACPFSCYPRRVWREEKANSIKTRFPEVAVKIWKRKPQTLESYEKQLRKRGLAPLTGLVKGDKIEPVRV